MDGNHQYLEDIGSLQVAIGEHDLLNMKTGLFRSDSGLGDSGLGWGWYLQHIPPHSAAADANTNHQPTAPYWDALWTHRGLDAFLAAARYIDLT